ncbi:acetylornithine deacetylase [Desulfonema ishimotonii]|uniref:Probable succinyl-diaminopimelate desuccinylase n=1 Tax=Desulfonema ishimotonii TaxID=45657 RepID=A0A401FVV7_9BACT|nr:M20 family metallopeptidase [Desulfonema ishimotonii]GBC61101.1 acetylornithine deacetylase [Desulfonema ishimotonii]
MSKKTDVIELTRKLIRFNTINPPGNEGPCAEFLGDLLASAGFAVRFHEFAPGRTGLVARRGGCSEKKPLCLAGHIDTVPLGGASWRTDPFGGEIAGGKLYGRGSSDMKSGIAAAVAAGIALADRLDSTPGLTLVFVAGEETGCEGSAYLATVPEELGEAGALIVAEPTGNIPIIGHKGAFWLDAVTCGKSAHGSMPEKGENAIYKAARAVLKLEQFDFGIAPHPYLGRPTLNVGVISGGVNINSVPDRTAFGIDIRTVPGLSHDALFRRLSEALGDEVMLSQSVSVEGLWTEPSHPWIESVCETLTPILGERPEVRTVSYFTDAGYLMPAFGGVPSLIMGPGEAGMAHQTDEYCFLEKIGQAVEIYTQIVAEWCGL